MFTVSEGDKFQNDKTGKLVIVTNADDFRVSFVGTRNGNRFGAKHQAFRSDFHAKYTRVVEFEPA